MPVVLGIDEAGYGPVLGPFVCVGTLWDARPSGTASDDWALLGDAIRRPGDRQGDGRLPVGDSKQVFDRQHGLHTLERSVLAFAETAGLQTDSVATLLASVGAELGAAGTACPWYRDLTRRLPTDPARGACHGAAERLRRSMARAGFRLRAARAIVVTEDHFNARVRATRNKSAVVIEAVLTLIDQAGRAADGTPLIVRADRLGGRSNYRDLLMAAFPNRPLAVEAAGQHESAYRLGPPPAPWEIAFLVHAEQRHVPVALASMFAKYIRELLMDAFNAYWARAAPGVRPTAGYYTDAQRFLADIRPALAASGTPAPGDFVRAR